jgi:hypothetical protein
MRRPAKIPAGVALAHVGGWFNRRGKFESAVANTDSRDDCTGDYSKNASLENDATDKGVDYSTSACAPS